MRIDQMSLVHRTLVAIVLIAGLLLVLLAVSGRL